MATPEDPQWYFDGVGCNDATAQFLAKIFEGTSLARQLVAAAAVSEDRPLRPEPPAAQEGQSQVSGFFWCATAKH